jgi:hypothetical protein
MRANPPGSRKMRIRSMQLYRDLRAMRDEPKKLTYLHQLDLSTMFLSLENF